MSIESLKKVNEENQRMIRVNAGVLHAALREIKSQAKINGEGLFTGMVIFALEEALKK